MRGHREVIWSDGFPMGMRQVQCECGWKSKVYLVHDDWAMRSEARRHRLLSEDVDDDGFVTVYASGAWQ